MRRGSISVFLALVLVLLLSFVFSMLEGARVCCLRSEAAYLSKLCGQSVFSNYHKGLWEDYHLLFLDGSWGEEDFDIGKLEGKAMAEAESNLERDTSENKAYAGKGLELMQLQCRDVCAGQYLLATDEEGKAFLQAVYRQMSLEIPYDVLKELKSQKEQSRELKGKSREQEVKWDQAWDAVAEAQEIQAQADQEQPEVQEEPGTGQDESKWDHISEEPQENPMDYVKQLKTSSLLSLVLPQGSTLSTKGLSAGSSPGERKLQQGTMTITASESWKDLTLWYFIQQYFSSFTGQSEKGPDQRSLDYELEYLIAGKDNDGENLEAVVKELLTVREAMNFITLLGDGGKRQRAMTLATALVGFTGIVPLVVAVQMGILLAWAFVESVLDVRALLEGRKIPLLKTAGQWSSDIGNCRKTIEANTGSPDEEKGFTYAQYLLMLLFLHSAKELSFRCMALIEANEHVQMDHMIAAAKLEFSYRANPLFWNMSFLKIGGWKELSVFGQADCSYVGG